MAERTVHEWMNASSLDEGQSLEETAIIKDICGSIDLGLTNLSDILLDLQPYVGADQTDAVTVGRGIACLASIFSALQIEALPRHDVHAMVEYLCIRLQNRAEVVNYKYGLGDVAEILATLAEWHSFPPGDCALICDSIFTLSTTFKDQSKSTRYKFYSLIALLVEKYPRQIERDMSYSQFVSGLLDLAESEGGTFSLKTLFTLYAKIGREWDLAQLEVKNIWDSISRYFPVTLGVKNLSPDQPQPEELRLLLLECVSSNDKFAEEALPSLLSDLDRSDANKKVEVFAMLKACVTSYSITTLLQWSSKIWDGLKFEIWNGEIEEDVQASLRILNGLVLTLGRPVTQWEGNNSFSAFVNEVCDECFQRLSDMERYVLPSARILYSIGSTSPIALNLAVQRILPRLDVLAQDTASRVSKKSLIGVYNYILQARLDIANEAETFPSRMESYEHATTLINIRQDQEEKLTRALASFQQSIVEVYFGTMSELNGDDSVSSPNISMSTAAMEGLVTLTLIPIFLSSAEKGIIIQALISVVVNPKKDKELQNAALSSLQQISSKNPDGYQELVLPTLLKQLPTKLSIEAEQRTAEVEVIEKFLENLIQVTSTSVCTRELESGWGKVGNGLFHRNHDAFQRALFEKFAAVVQHKAQAEYTNLILAAALRSIELFDPALGAAHTTTNVPWGRSVDGAYSHVIFPYLRRILALKAYGDGKSYIGLQGMADEAELFDEISIRLLGRLITTILVSEASKNTEDFFSYYEENKPLDPPAISSLFVQGAPKELVQSQFDLDSAPSEKCAVVLLTVSLLAGAPAKADSKGIDLSEIAMLMIQNSVSPNVKCSKFSRLSMMWLVQLLVNKFRAGGAPSDVKGPLVQQILTLADKSSKKTDIEAENIYWLLAYFTAGSLAAYTNSVEVLVEKMVAGITKPSFGRKVSQSFRILLAPSGVITHRNGCTIRSLRQTRLYEVVMKRLMAIWRVTKDKVVKENCLIAVAGVLAYMEPNILQQNVDTILPPVLEGTNLQDEEWSKSACISIIKTLIPLCPRAIEGHLDSVINRMTDRTHNTYDSPSDSSVRCRVLALEVLRLLPEHIKPSLLEQRKSKVVSELDVALDDCSREVRHKAEVAKMIWFNLN
ncbi:hypothetical protein G7Y89_g1563 [Cudoniella acicularis]|uniref:MMS19 nucleotide excision repair protein n=1 Tax=Cudoniella acicularis TaxID=354080 RepID=A0A8H4RW50_9HELO|nr:hypothetical protein G7Y89_g1563 [Cudoniella acicularis]